MLVIWNCHFQIPAKNLLGELGQGYKYSIEVLNEGRIGIGAQVIEKRWSLLYRVAQLNVTSVIYITPIY